MTYVKELPLSYPERVMDLNDWQKKNLLWWLQDAISSILTPNGSDSHAEKLQQLHDALKADEWRS